MPDDTQKNNNRIKELRQEQHKTQKQVADFLGITDQAVANYEKGLREPKLKDWQKLADFFGVSLLYITGQSEQSKLMQVKIKSFTPYRKDQQQKITASVNVNLDDLIKEYRLKENFLAPVYLSDLLKGAPIYKKDGIPLSDKETEILKSFLEENFKDLS